MDILFKRGVEAKRGTFTPKPGEPVFTTDEKELYIGDGSTAGGIPVGTVKPSGTLLGDMIALFTDATGKVLKGISKADFLQGYATESWVTQKIAGDAVGIKVNSAKHADVADEAKNLNGHSDYLRPTVITQSYQEDNANKVGSARALKSLYDRVVSLINGVKNDKLDKTSLSNSVTSSNTNIAATSLAVKTVNDKATEAQTLANSVKSTASNALSTASHANSEVAGVKSDLVSISAKATNADVRSRSNLDRLNKLPKVTNGRGNPSGGSDGDVYVQYK